MSNNHRKHLYIYIAVTLGCGLFSFVYELFSHDVYSNFMVYLFAVPLLLGVVPELAALVNTRLTVSSSWGTTLRALAVATLTVGSILRGVVEIYGTTNQYIMYYFVVGLGMLFASIVMWALRFTSHRTTAD